MRRMLSPLVGAACLAILSVAGGSAPRWRPRSCTGPTPGDRTWWRPPIPTTPDGTRDRASTRSTGRDMSRRRARVRTFTGVTTTFVVTTVDTSVDGDQYSVDWVGIGGFADRRLVQAGVEEDNIGGRAFYQAWTEVLPQSEVPLLLTVSPGDRVTITVRETANKRNRDKRWSMTVYDVSTGRGAGKTVRYNASGTSAEAIHERPCIAVPCSANLATLATTSPATFDPAYYTTSQPDIPAAYQPLLKATTLATLYAISMLPSDATSSTPPIATPSIADSDNDGFTVADGSALPSPPAS